MKKTQNPIKISYLYLDAWFNRAFGTELNPLYHLGTLTFFLFWIVLVSGVYIFLFFDTSINGAFQSVEYMTHEQWYLAGVMRSLHRYASDAAVVTVLLHILREFCLDRYRGFRWFSWFTGIPTLWLLILLGITGYWLVWDQLAQYIAVGSGELLDVLPIFVDSMARNFLAGNMSDRFFTLMALIHLLGLPIMLIFALWIHVKRLTKVEIVVPRGLATGTFIALLILSFVYPAVSHKPADLNITPAVLHLDWFYLGIYPLLDYWTPAETWTLTTGITLLLMIMPWLPPKRMEPAAKVSLSHCNGCAQCFDDCPFHAISMQARTDGARWLQEAAVNPDWCAACGICVSSCPYSNPSRHADTTLTTGIDMPHYPVHQLRDDTDAALVKLNKEPGKILVYSCDHSADPAELNDPDLVTISLPCTGMLPASFITYALKKGADGVLVLGCRCGDCYYRFGNRWMNERLSYMRKPFLPARADRLRVGIYGAAETDMEKLRQEIAEFRNALRNGEQPACSPVQAATKQEQQRCGRG